MRRWCFMHLGVAMSLVLLVSLLGVEQAAGSASVLSVDPLAQSGGPVAAPANGPVAQLESWDEFGPGEFFYAGEQVIISVSDEAVDRPWSLTGPASALLRTPAAADVLIETRIEVLPYEAQQMAGILILAEAGGILRFDIVRDGQGLRLRRTSDPGTNQESSESVPFQEPALDRLILRVSQTGDRWSISTSTDGVTWLSWPSLAATLEGMADRVGPFAARDGGSTANFGAPYSAVFDNFSVGQSDLQTQERDVTPPAIVDVGVSRSSTSLAVTWATNEPTVSHVEWGLAGFPNDEGTGSLDLSNRALLSGLEPATRYQLRITARDHSGNEVERYLRATTQAEGVPGLQRAGAAAAGSDTVFDVWYGDSQKFGKRGRPQRWVNILGKVSDADGIAKLEYKIGGGNYRELSIGADLRRLAGAGDFNADILATDLALGGNVVTLRLTDLLGNRQMHDLQVERRSANTWPLPYAVNWSAASSVSDKVQVVDGNWVLENDSLTLGNLDVGYDRLAAIGDTSWTSYEALVPFTVNSISPNANASPSGGPGVGVIMHWNGHNDDIDPTAQPLVGFRPKAGPDPTPLGSIMWWRKPKNKSEQLQIADHYGFSAAADTNFSLQVGKQYKLRARALVGAAGVTYSMKMWRSNQAEPQNWSLTYSAGKDDREPQSGSLVLVSHEVDVSYGNISVTPINASEAAAPAFSIPEGIVDDDQQIVLSSSTPGATIYYTVDGSQPTAQSTQYIGAFSLSADAEIEAVAYADGFDPSAISSASYVVNSAPAVTVEPGFSVAVGVQTDLVATVIDDGVTGELSLLWSKQSGPGAVSFTTRRRATTKVTFSAPGTYLVRFRADDGRLQDVARVSVQVTAPPTTTTTTTAPPTTTTTAPPTTTTTTTTAPPTTTTTAPPTTTTKRPPPPSTTTTTAAPTTTTTRPTTTTAPPAATTSTTTTVASTTTTTVPPALRTQGYWLLDGFGGLYNFGDAQRFVSVDVLDMSTAVSLDRARGGSALWVLDSSGQVHVRGSARHFGNVEMSALSPGEKVSSIAAIPSGRGYWVFTDIGRVVAFGEAQNFGDLPALSIRPVGVVVASSSTPSGAGYYMLGSDGGVFTFGDAVFKGSVPEVLDAASLACPIVGLVPAPAGNGYWMVACDGGVFAFGDAPFRGSVPGVLAPGTALNSPIIGLASYGAGYVMVASDGGVFSFSDRQFVGSLGGSAQPAEITGLAAFETGY